VAQPPPYNRAFNFANQQALTPADPVPAPRIDEELNRVKLTLDQVLANIALIQRDDTAIANQTIGYDQLKAELDGFGFNPPTEWEIAKNYVVRDTVFFDNSFYRADVSHISGVFATDLAAGKWVLIADFTSATTEAVAARDKAQQWAENPEDSAVETGQFSALHHAAKSADSATASATSATAAAGSATAAANSATAAGNSATAAAASAGTASGAAGTAQTSAGNAMTSANAAAASATAADASADAAAASAAAAATFDPAAYETKWATKRDVNLAANVETDGYSQISFHGVAAAPFSARLLRGSGANGDFTIAQTGTGNLNLDGGAALLRDSNKVIDASDGALVSSGVGERTLLGVIRQSTDSGGWAFLNDAGHAPIGFNAATISQSTTDITLPFSFTGARVRSLLAVPDETFARRGLICGASVGTSSATLQLALPLAATVPVNGYSGGLITDPAFAGAVSSSHNAGTGVVTITHPTVIEGGVPPILGATRGSTINSTATDAVGGIVVAGGYGASGAETSFEVQMHTEMAGFVSWTSGTSFSVSTDCAGTYSATWDGGTNFLTVNHPPADSLYDITIASAAGSFAQVHIFSATKTSFVAIFLDETGTLLSTPNNRFKLYFKRSSTLVRKLPFTPSFLTFSRGHGLVNPNKLYSASGNIWLFGVVETTS